MNNYANVLMRTTLFQGKKEKVIFDIIKEYSHNLKVEPPKILFYRSPRIKRGRFKLAYHKEGKLYISDQLLNKPIFKISLILLHEYWHYYSKYLKKGGAFAELILTNSDILEEVMADSFSFRSTLTGLRIRGSPNLQKKIIKRSYIGKVQR